MFSQNKFVRIQIMLNITPVSDYVVWVVSSSSNPVRFITSSYVSVRSLSIIASQDRQPFFEQRAFLLLLLHFFHQLNSSRSTVLLFAVFEKTKANNEYIIRLGCFFNSCLSNWILYRGIRLNVKHL